MTAFDEEEMRAAARACLDVMNRHASGRVKRPRGQEALCASCASPVHGDRHVHLDVLPYGEHFRVDQHVELCSRKCAIQWVLFHLDIHDEIDWADLADYIRDYAPAG